MAATAARHHYSPFTHARQGFPLDAPAARSSRMASCRPLCPGMLLAQHPEGFDAVTWQWHELQPAVTWASSSDGASDHGWEVTAGGVTSSRSVDGRAGTSRSSGAQQGSSSSIVEVPPLDVLLRCPSSSNTTTMTTTTTTGGDQDSRDWEQATHDPALARHVSGSTTACDEDENVEELEEEEEEEEEEAAVDAADPAVTRLASGSSSDARDQGSSADWEQAVPDAAEVGVGHAAAGGGSARSGGSFQDSAGWQLLQADPGSSFATCPRSSTGGSRGWGQPLRALEALVQDLRTATETMQAGPEPSGSSSNGDDGPETPAAAALEPVPLSASNPDFNPMAEPSFDAAAVPLSPASPPGSGPVSPAPQALQAAGVNGMNYTSTSNNPQLFGACWADVRRSFQARGGGQLTVHRGDQVLVLAEDEEGWLTVERCSGPRGAAAQGMIPAACAVLEAATP